MGSEMISFYFIPVIVDVPRMVMAAGVCWSVPGSHNPLLGSWGRWCTSSRWIGPHTFCPFPDPPCTAVIIFFRERKEKRDKRDALVYIQVSLDSPVPLQVYIHERVWPRESGQKLGWKGEEYIFSSFPFSQRKWKTMKGLYRHFRLFKRPFHFIYFFPKLFHSTQKGCARWNLKFQKFQMIAKIRIRVEWMIQNVTGIPIRHAPLIKLVFLPSKGRSWFTHVTIIWLISFLKCYPCFKTIPQCYYFFSFLFRGGWNKRWPFLCVCGCRHHTRSDEWVEFHQVTSFLLLAVFFWRGNFKITRHVTPNKILNWAASFPLFFSREREREGKFEHVE